MRRLTLSLIIIILLSNESIIGQDIHDSTSEKLENLFARLDDNFDDADRIRINDSIRFIINTYVRSDSIFSHRLPGLSHLGQIFSPDSLLKIVTWNLVLKNNPGIYFCYFIKKGEQGRKINVYSLTTSYKQDSLHTDTTYSGRNWYGALYYEIKPFLTDNGQCWVLLGIDYGNPVITRKIIEVLSFSGDDSLVLGRKWFDSGTRTAYRVVLEYASNAMITLRFVSGKSIVFDHLVPLTSGRKGERQFYGPDYSYDAYNFENGIWKLSINVDARNNE